jgi:hypothetical protein
MWIQQWLLASYPVPSGSGVLYTYTSTNNNTWLNWNNANDNYAWSFTTTAAWTPTTLVLRIQSITGTPTGNIYIKADKTAASTTYGTATWVTFTSGTNTITLTWTSALSNATTYWVYFQRTSNSSNYFRIYNEYTSPPAQQFWRPSASNIDPDTRYDSWSKNIGMSMTLNWTS